MLLFNLVNLITNKMCWHSYTPHNIEIIAEASYRVPVYFFRALVDGVAGVQPVS